MKGLIPVPTIEQLSAFEILDSRGRPTIQVNCKLASGESASAQVPSGASTGKSEAVELRDGDASRHGGLGCRKSVAHVNETIAGATVGASFETQGSFDQSLLKLDGTPDKSRLGANAILGASLSFARASAKERRVPFYDHFATMLGHVPSMLPVMTINLFSGGKHAGGQVPIQDVLIVPTAARTIDEGLATACAVFQAGAKLIDEKYNMRCLTADEGGLAPPFKNVESMFDDALTAIERAGFIPGKEVKLAVDVASSQFFEQGTYRLGKDHIDARGMIDEISAWVDRYPILSVEDGLAEDDWRHWPMLRERLSNRALTLGDDLLCTHPDRIQKAIELGACDALLLKVNQVGTLSEAAVAMRLARDAGWQVTISARSGETEDNWLADLAVGWGGDHLKIGSVTQSDRLAKYNRLLEIEVETRFPCG